MLIPTSVHLSSSEIRGWLFFNHPFTNVSMWQCYLLALFFSFLFYFSGGSKEKPDLFEANKIYGKRGGQLVQETSRDSALQSILPNVCPNCFIYSLHFSFREWNVFSVAFPARKTGMYSSEARGGHQDDTGSGTHDIWEEAGNSIHSVLSGKRWLNICLFSLARERERTDKVDSSLEEHPDSLVTRGILAR